MLLQLLCFAALLACAQAQCQQGWRENEGTCYFFSSEEKTWFEAQSYCLEQHSNLLSIRNIHEILWLRTQVGSEVYWMGLNDYAAEGVWEWSDGTTYLEYISNWMGGQPDNLNEEDCGELVGYENGQWNDEDCDSTRKFICKHINENPVPQCDLNNGWRLHGSDCYKVKADTRKTWSEARHDCVMEGGDLVSILSMAEEIYVTGSLDQTYFDMWIGLSTLKCNKISCEVQQGNSQLSWSDAVELGYTNWGNNQTVVDTESGSCSSIIKDRTEQYGKWRLHPCKQERPYMCKRALSTICPDGWLSFSGSCYWLVSNTDLLTSWHEAHTKCTDESAHLLIINNQEEQYFINGRLPDFHHVDIPDIWIGLSDKDKDGSFRWVDNTEVQFSNYGTNWPQNTPNLWDCGQIFTGNYDGKWETANCFKRLGYICEMTGGQNPTRPTVSPDSHCDQGYLLYGDFCYQFETEMTKSWQEAEDHCKSEQGHLASVHTQAELSFITGHMPISAWIGLNDINTEGTFTYTDGTPADLLPWGPLQPDNWEGNEDCVHIRGMDHVEPGKFNDDVCTATHEFICKKAKGQGPPPQPPTSGPGWDDKCGTWTSDPFNDYCYLFNYLSIRTWAEARADCANQGGHLASITDPFEQAFIYGVIKQAPTGTALWIGGHDSVTESGWEWMDGSPFRYVHWSEGSPNDYLGEDCLSIYINDGYWNDNNCENKRGYVCKRRGLTPEPPPPHDGFYPVLVCQETSTVLHCPHDSVINVQSAFYGRKNSDVCPHLGQTDGSCTIEGVLPLVRKLCDNHQFCFAYAHPPVDPCPTVSKYLEIIYSCEQKVCLHGLGVEDGNITNSQLSASSSVNPFTPDKARLNGDSCWMPSGAATSSWIQVNLGETRKVTGIVIQGCPQGDNWITKFKIQHSMDGASWTDYTADGASLPGSTDRNNPETQLLGTPVSALYIRILPLEVSGQAGLRFDVLGCTPDYAVTCEHKPEFDSSIDKMTVHCPAGCGRKDYIVYGTDEYRGDSSTCAAAIHAGVVLNDLGGDLTLLKTDGRDFYAGSTRHGITTRQSSGNFALSYKFADGEVRCPGPEWFEFEDYCYSPFGDKKTWHESRQICRSMGADLLSIRSMTEQSWVESYLFASDVNIWTGMNDLGMQGFFTWSDGHWVSFTYWAPGEPNNHAGFKEDCVEMLHETGRWNDAACTILNGYVCKMAKGHYPAPSVAPTQYGCPAGWDAYRYSCYWVEETARTWTEAKGFCAAKDSFLVHVEDIYEQSHFTVVLSGKSDMWWIGLRAHGDEHGGVEYAWDNGLPVTFTHWDRDQPDSDDGSCVAMTSGQVGGFWDDKPCADKNKFMCEKFRPDISPPTQAPTPPPSQGCADGWTANPHFRNCYRLFHNVDWSMRKSWAGANEDCLARGGSLVSIHSYEEEEFLALYTKGSSKWIGLRHNTVEGGYSWSNGMPLSHTNWGPDEPNDHEGREECVEMVSNNNGTASWWNDINCDAHQDWICMISKGKTPIVPPAPPSPVPAPECGTNPGWRKNNNICYYYNDTDTVDFATAMYHCYDEKARLVSILSQSEQEFVNSLVGTGKLSAAWIGLWKAGNTNGEFRWLDQSPITYTHWDAGEPNNGNGEEHCVQMNRHRGAWNDANCGRTVAGYVCKKFPGEDHTSPAPTQPWEGHCPEGWKLFGNKCFLFKGDKDDVRTNWTSAQAFCREQEGNLAVIDSHYENDFVASYLRDLRFATWIGLSDILLENEYAWSDGVSPVLYTNWNNNEPNNVGGAEHCVAMSHNHLLTGKWNDDACHRNHSFVCSRMKSSSIPAPPPTPNPCPDGYTSWYSSCYKLVQQPATWDAALEACRKDTANLASIDSSYEQAFVSGVVVRDLDAWIGLRRKDSSYTWSDGWPVFFTHWGPGEPSNVADEGCVAMHGARFFHGTWNDTKCDLAKPYICKITTEKPPPTLAPGSGKCLPFWETYGHHCYFVYNGQQGFSWPDSRHYCQSAKGELASIHSRAEVEFIRNLNYTKYHDLWIGLTRDSNFGWAWTDYTSLGFLNWAPGEPNEAFHPGEPSDENCVEMRSDGSWNDNNCMEKRGFVCQHRQYHTTDDNGKPVIPTYGPTPGFVSPSNGGIIAGAIIAAVVVCVLIAALLYYVFRVKGYKVGGMRMQTQPANVTAPAFSNPNFPGESFS